MAKDQELRFRVEQSLAEAVTAAAELNDQSMSEYCRSALQAKLEAEAEPGGDAVGVSATIDQGL